MHIRYVISSSGGLGSAVSALAAYEHDLDFEMVFADTLIEDEDLYRFLREIAAAVNKEIVWLKDGRDPWQVFVDKRYIGNSRIAHCSQLLKTAKIKEWWDENGRPGDVLVLGMDGSELDRIERAQETWAPIPVISLLTQLKVRRPQFEEYLERYGIKRPRLYDMGFPHNNCGGMCVRSGLKQFATLLERMPERFRYHEERQLEAMEAIGPTAKPFLRQMVDGKTSYMTLRTFREGVEAGTMEVNPYDFGGCECFVGDSMPEMVPSMEDLLVDEIVDARSVDDAEA